VKQGETANIKPTARGKGLIKAKHLKTMFKEGLKQRGKAQKERIYKGGFHRVNMENKKANKKVLSYTYRITKNTYKIEQKKNSPILYIYKNDKLIKCDGIGSLIIDLEKREKVNKKEEYLKDIQNKTLIDDSGIRCLNPPETI
jgi:hypothetical protein